MFFFSKIAIDFQYKRAGDDVPETDSETPDDDDGEIKYELRIIYIIYKR